MTAGLDPVESLVSFAAVGAAGVKTFESRGWDERESAAGGERLRVRGLLSDDGGVTDAGRALRAEIERRTDELAAVPWRTVGDEERDRLADLLGPLWVRVLGSGLLPGETTLGIGKV